MQERGRSGTSTLGFRPGRIAANGRNNEQIHGAGRCRVSALCLLSGIKRTWPLSVTSSGYDPKRTWRGLKSRSAAARNSVDFFIPPSGTCAASAAYQAVACL